MNDCSDKIQPVQPVEQIRMLVKSYPKQEDSKKRKREEKSMLNFKELLEKAIAEANDSRDALILDMPSVFVKQPSISSQYNAMDMLFN